MRLINVIIADDDCNARAGLMDMIAWESIGANVIAAVEDGEQVIQLLEQCPGIDLIILDICMPYMDGLSVAKHIREKSYETEIILLSAHAEFDYAREALKYDIREYIIKPINRAKLQQLTNTIQAVSEEKDMAIKWKLYLHSAELQEDVKSALRYKDMQAVEALLDTDKRFGPLSTKMLKEYCSVLMGHLCEYSQKTEKDTGSRESRMKLFYELSDVKTMISFLKDSFSAEMYADGADTGKSGANIVMIAKKYIDNNILSSDMGSYSVASHVNLSVDHLSRLFKSAGENSLSDYIIKSKIDKAKEIISASSYSIRQVAQILGYTDPNYFVKVFKKKTGVTPTEFRLQTKEQEEQ